MVLHSVNDYRKVLTRRLFLEQVLQELNIDPSTSDYDAESIFKREKDLNGGGKGLEASLLANDTLAEESALKIIGGSVARTEVQMLKKLLFRGTRGKALLTTFFLAEDESDKMNNVDFGFDKMIGYIIIYQDNLNIGRII